MEEKTLHYIWQNKLYDGKNLKTTKGEIIEIIDPGLLNIILAPFEKRNKNNDDDDLIRKRRFFYFFDKKNKKQ